MTEECSDGWIYDYLQKDNQGALIPKLTQQRVRDDKKTKEQPMARWATEEAHLKEKKPWLYSSKGNDPRPLQ